MCDQSSSVYEWMETALVIQFQTRSLTLLILAAHLITVSLFVSQNLP